MTKGASGPKPDTLAKVFKPGSGLRPVRTAIQRFHLGPDRRVSLSSRRAVTFGDGADISFFSSDSTKSRVVKGGSTPLMGWRSPFYREKVAVPVLENILTGSAMRFTTVLIARPGDAHASSVAITNSSRTSRSASVTVHAGGGVVERIMVAPSHAYVRKIR